MDALTALLRRAQRGERACLDAFIRETHRDVTSLCRSLVGVELADDAVQETYLALWQGLAGFRGDSSGRTWLFSIARRTAFRVRTKDRRLDDLARHRALDSTSDAVSTTEIALLLDLVSPDRREALVLTQVLGLSYEEAAVVCECAVGTIRSRVARARGELFDLLTAADESATG